MNTVTLKLPGTAPLLLNNARLANPFDPFARRLKVAVERRKKDKTDEAMMECARVEWEGSLYFDPKLGPVLPAINVERAIVEGARMTRGGKKIERAVISTASHLALQYDGPRDVESMWADGRFVDQRTCVVQRRTVVRTRPIFHEWSVVVTLSYDAAQIDEATLLCSARDAGGRVGIGNFRPSCGGHFGTFDVEVVS